MSQRDSRLLPGLINLLHLLLAPAVTVVGLMLSGLFYDVTLNDEYRVLALLAFLCVLFVFRQTDGDAYRHRTTSTSLMRVMQRTFVSWGSVLAILALLAFTLQYVETFSRRMLLTWAVFTPVAIAVLRYNLDVWLARRAHRQGLGRTAVIVGVNDLSRRLARAIETRPRLGLRLLGWFEDRSMERVGGLPAELHLGRLDELPAFVNDNAVDVIYIALPIRHLERTRRLLDELQDTTASIYFVPDIFVYDLIQSRVEVIDNIPAVALCESPFVGINGLLKRLFDLGVGSVILLLTLPFMALIAAALALTTRESVIFRQRRYGLDGEEITVYKFRTMVTSDDGHDVPQATQDDARVTRIGRFLRRTSLDELPQLYNVLQGRMSLVGPRPHAVAHNELYRKLIKGYMIRHKVLPGITGLAQVNGLRGETKTVDQMEARVHYDLEYLRNWSIFLDLKILALTALTVLRQNKAY